MSSGDSPRILRTMTENEWVTRTRAAELAGVSMRTVKRWADAGSVRFTRNIDSARVAYHLGDLLTHMESRAPRT